jgi:hypothetical protein
MEYVGWDKVTKIVEEFDQQVLMPFLVVASKLLNLGNVENFFPSTTIIDDSLWGVVAST